MILWNSLAGNRAGDLKYIFRENIITPDTRFVMEQCFQDIGEDELLKAWPGQVFRDDDPDFYALLGTPHGMYMKVSYYLLISGRIILSKTKWKGQLDESIANLNSIADLIHV